MIILSGSFAQSRGHNPNFPDDFVCLWIKFCLQSLGFRHVSEAQNTVQIIIPKGTCASGESRQRTIK